MSLIYDSGLETIEVASGPRARQRPTVLALTIAFHPTLEAIGAWATLPTDADSASLSRLEPHFGRIGGPMWGPLGDRHISRTPITITRMRSGVRLDCSATPNPVVIGGRPVDGVVEIDSDVLEAGVSIEIARRVVVVLHLASATATASPGFDLVGESAPLMAVREQIAALLPLDAPVLLLGESGTGKELVARALHLGGRRRERSFLAVNMAAIPAGTAASALFGHRAGSFTGADHASQGYFEAADGGTLFLDEIGDTPLEIQSALLRALEQREIQPVGASQPRSVDVRLIAATDVDLGAAVAAGRIKRALLHRLKVCEVRLPALRERRADIGPLFLAFSRDEEIPPTCREALLASLDAPTMTNLVNHSWPGNVRELRNLVRRCAATASVGGFVDVARWIASDPPPKVETGDLPGRIRPSAQGITDEELRRVLADCDWKPSAAAARLGISRTTLYARMKRSADTRKAADLADAEIEAALAATDGDVAAAAALLRVSERGLRLRRLPGASGGATS